MSATLSTFPHQIAPAYRASRTVEYVRFAERLVTRRLIGRPSRVRAVQLPPRFDAEQPRIGAA